MSDGDQLIKEEDGWVSLVPELLVSDLQRSVDVYTGLFGFGLDHVAAERIAVLALGGEQLVLRQYRPDDPLVVAELTTPFGRGVTINVRTADPKVVYEALREKKFPLVVPMEISELEDGGERYTQTSFVVADPDGYLLRFSD